MPDASEMMRLQSLIEKILGPSAIERPKDRDAIRDFCYGLRAEIERLKAELRGEDD